MKQTTAPMALPRLANVRRRVFPLGSTAAALALSGCGMLGPQPKAAPAREVGAALTAQRTEQQVQAFTAGLDEALEKVDREKLRAAGGEKNSLRDAEKTSVPMDGAGVSGKPTAGVEVSRAAGTALASALTATAELGSYAALPAKLELHLDGAAPMLTLASAQPAIRAQFALADPIRPGWNDPIVAAKTSAMIPPAPAAPAAAATPRAAVQPSIDSVMEVIRGRVAAHPTLNTALALALLESAEGKTADSAIGKELSASDQKLLEDLTGALTGMAGASPTGSLTERALPLVDAAKKWQADGDLVLPKLALASRVDSYGVYTKVDPKFSAGTKQTVIIYCEVANFVPKKTEDGWFETHLSQQETLATDDGLLVWRPNAEEVEDRSKNQRRDFYLVKKLTIPDNLAVGKYALRMSVTDRNTGKIAVVNLPIEIVK